MIGLMENYAGREPVDFKKSRRQKATLEDSLPEQKLPPHSIPAERAVLGCVLIKPSCLNQCIEEFKAGPEIFFDLKNRMVYEAMLRMMDGGESIDVVTLQQDLKDMLQLESVGGITYIASLPDATPSADNIGHYIPILIEKYTLRKAIAFTTEFAGRAYDEQGDVSGIIEELEQDIRQLADSKNLTTLAKANTLVPKSIDWMEAAHANQGQLSGIPTGFVDFDQLMGGLQAGELIVIAARPSVGKSSWCMNVADYVAVNLNIPVAVFSLEMTALQLMNRTVCSRARVSLTRVREGQIGEGDFGKLTNSASAIAHAPLYIDDASGTSIAQLRAKARRLHEQLGVRLMMVDYLQLLRGSSRRSESRQQEVTEISAGLKSLTKELNIPILVASQLNREVDKEKKGRKPRMSDIRESGAIEQDGDVIGFLYKPVKDEDEEEAEQDQPSALINLLIAKNRNGRTGEVRMTFLKSFTRFESAAQHHE